jgi:serine/threonine protein kinase
VAATASADEYTVPFYGFITASSSIVMSAVPLALSTHVEECALRAKENFSTRTMMDPVMSMPCWTNLAGQLIKGLGWLHAEAGVVHGDIKPHNILLRRRRVDDGGSSAEFQFEALFADFSSAHRVSLEESSHLGEVALSALTPPFAAPELMTVAAMKATGLSTPASDVFSLALTLLAAATGDLLLYPGTSSMQRLAMSREGYRVLDFVRSGHHGTRVPRRGLVERTIAPAVVKNPSERVETAGWLDILSSA